MLKNLEDLIKTIRDRKNSSPEKSYTNKLLNDKKLSVSKVKEEFAELFEAALVYYLATVKIFHILAKLQPLHKTISCSAANRKA